jgi:hypothetical protein
MSDWQVQYAERMAACDRDDRYLPVIRSACGRVGIPCIVEQNPDLLELMAFLESWDGGDVGGDRLVRYAVDWLTNPT